MTVDGVGVGQRTCTKSRLYPARAYTTLVVFKALSSSHISRLTLLFVLFNSFLDKRKFLFYFLVVSDVVVGAYGGEKNLSFNSGTYEPFCGTKTK